MTATIRWALITGVSAGGLGDALTQELLSRSINVIATALKLEMLDYLHPSPTAPATATLSKLQLDVTDSASISAVAGATHRITSGKLDFLFNNAGYGYMMPLMDCSIDSVRANFDVNVFGLLAVTQAFFPLLREAKGTVVNQSSISGLQGCYQPFIGSYGASKSAVSHLSDTLRVELAPFDIKVVTLITGDVRTQFWSAAQSASGSLPADSPYMRIRDKAEAVMRGQTNPPGSHPRQRVAEQTVDDLLRSKPPMHIRRAYLAKTMWVVSCLFPFWVLDYLYSQSTDLWKLRGLIANEEGKKAM